MTIEHTGSGTFIDSEPIAAPDGVADDPNVRIYAYARFRSLEHVSFGLYRTTGGPKDEEIDSEKVGEYGMEPIASYWEAGIAIEEIEKSKKKDSRLFEDEPLVEVTSEEEYNQAIAALGIDAEEGAWDRPGLYDFRDDPPAYHGTVEEYELDMMKDAADQAFDFMFQDDEWEEAYRGLAGEDEEEEKEEGDDEAFSDEAMREGYVIQDARRGGYDVGHEGKIIGHYEDKDEALEAINARMERDKFFPNIYFVNDHGNVDLLDSAGAIISSRV